MRLGCLNAVSIHWSPSTAEMAHITRPPTTPRVQPFGTLVSEGACRHHYRRGVSASGSVCRHTVMVLVVGTCDLRPVTCGQRQWSNQCRGQHDGSSLSAMSRICPASRTTARLAESTPPRSIGISYCKPGTSGNGGSGARAATECPHSSGLRSPDFISICSGMPQHPLSDPRDNTGAIHTQRRVWATLEPIVPQMPLVCLPHRGIWPDAIAPPIQPPQGARR